MEKPLMQKHRETARQTGNLSFISMIFGILSIICLIAVVLFRGDPPADFFIAETSVIAVTTGMVAFFRIRKDRNLPGKEMAITGLVCGGVIITYILSFFIVVLIRVVSG